MIKRVLLKDSAIYGASNIIGGFIPFLAIILISRVVSPYDYGVYSLAAAIITFLSPFCSLGLSFSIRNRFFQYKRERLAQHISACSFISFLAAVIIGIAWIPFASSVAQYTGIPTVLHPIFFVAIFSGAINKNNLLILSMERRPLAYAVLRVSTSLVFYGCFVLWIYYVDRTFKGLISMQLFNALLLLSVCLPILYKGRYLIPSFRRSEAVAALRYGMPLVFHLIAFNFILILNRFFLKDMMSFEVVGIYALGYQVSHGLYLAISSIVQAWMPVFFRHLQEDLNRKSLLIASGVLCLLIIAASIIFSLIFPFLIDFVIGEKYSVASDLIPWLAAGFCLYTLFDLMAGYLYHSEKTGRIATIAIIAAVCSVFLNYYLIDARGIIGAAQAMPFSFLIAIILLVTGSWKDIYYGKR
ncbi:MAG: lipopolysaccharide biosynthesis protein [Alphaproteobacteria bacterium]